MFGSISKSCTRLMFLCAWSASRRPTINGRSRRVVGNTEVGPKRACRKLWRAPPRVEGEHSKSSSASGEALEGATLERMRLTALCHGCSHRPVLAERLGHLIKAKHHDEQNEEESDAEHAAPCVKGPKKKTQQKPHRSHLPSSRPRPTPISSKTRPETIPKATHRRTADREYS